MAISDYFSSKFGSSAPVGVTPYTWGTKYGTIDVSRPPLGLLDFGTPVSGGTPGTVTGSIDGSSPSVDWLKGLTSAVLQNMGSRGDGAPQATPVAYTSGGDGGGGMNWGVIALGALAVGAVIYAAQSK